jgi:hypothetical protein
MRIHEAAAAAAAAAAGAHRSEFENTEYAGNEFKAAN